MEILKKFLNYILLRKNTEGNPNFNLRMMHGINKISILMFLMGMIVLIIRCSR